MCCVMTNRPPGPYCSNKYPTNIFVLVPFSAPVLASKFFGESLDTSFSAYENITVLSSTQFFLAHY